MYDSLLITETGSHMKTMESRLLTSTKQLAKIFRTWSHKADDIRVVTAWATMDCAVCDSLRKARSKISTMVVGLDFHSTAPSFLKDFWSIVRIGEVVNHGGTFHPKLYLFRNRTNCCCVMGSSNFTSGGFGGNRELNICIEGRGSDPFFRQITRYIDDVEKTSDRINSAVFDDYKSRYAALQNARRELSKFTASKSATARAKAKRSREAAGQEPPEQLNRGWSEFLKLILAGKRRQRVVKGNSNELSYLQTAERCHELFARCRRLAKMGFRDRQFIGGTIKEAGWFGSMIGAGEFKKRLNDSPETLDAALNQIALQGPVAPREFNAFAKRYERERAGVATASRLLAMKRPDLFICVDSKNRPGIARVFGVPASSLRRFDAYWELIQRIWCCPWWKAPEPKGALDRRIWKARVALLDSLYYTDTA